MLREEMNSRWAQRFVRYGLMSLAMGVSAWAADIDGMVVAIADGDTLTVLHDRQEVKIRLAEIDAPEKTQAFGQRSRQSLAELCFGQPASVRTTATDQYGRTVGRVTCAGVDANAEQVKRGMAWVYDRYNTDRTLYRLQDDARSARRGLWTDADPSKPWEWRQARRSKLAEKQAP